MCFGALTHCLWALEVCTIRGIGPQISRRAPRRPWSLHCCCNIWTYGCLWLKAVIAAYFAADTLTRLFQECELLDAFIGEMQAGTLHSGRWWWRSQRCTGSVMPTTSTCSKPMYHGLLTVHAWDQLRLCFGVRTHFCMLFSFGVLRMFGVHWLCVVLQPQLKVQCICRTHANLRLSCWKVKLVSILYAS